MLNLEGHRILLTHGHRYGVKNGLGGLLNRAAQEGADIVLFGHTHQPMTETVPSGTVLGGVTIDRPIRLFNPGSIGRNEDGEGRVFGTMILRGDTVLFSHGRI